MIKNKIINLFIRIIPLFTLFLTWSGIYGVTQYDGIIFLYHNMITSTMGLIIIFGEVFLKTNWKYKFGLNIFGNLIFWIPLFYGAIDQANSFGNLTVSFYLSLFIVFICFILQLKTIYKNIP